MALASDPSNSQATTGKKYGCPAAISSKFIRNPAWQPDLTLVNEADEDDS